MSSSIPLDVFYTKLQPHLSSVTQNEAGTEEGLSASTERFALLLVTSLTETRAKWPKCGPCHDQ